MESKFMLEGMRRSHYKKEFGNELGEALANLVDKAMGERGCAIFASNLPGWLALVDPIYREEALRSAEFRLLLRSMQPEVVREITDKNRLEQMVKDCQRAIEGPQSSATDEAQLAIGELTHKWKEAESKVEILKETLLSKERELERPWKWYIDRYGNPEAGRPSGDPQQN